MPKKQKKPRNPKRGRSPYPACEPSSPGAAPARPSVVQEVRRLKARLAELEAELQRATALLPDAFHDDPDVETLRRRTEPPSGPGSFAAAALRAVWQGRLSSPLIAAARKALCLPSIRCVPVDPAVTASWCVCPAAVPPAVAAQVVMPYVAPDVAFVGSVAGVVCGNAPAAAQIDALHAVLPPGPRPWVVAPAPSLTRLLCKLCAVRLPNVDLGRLADVLARLEVTDARTSTWFLCLWCRYRLGQAPLEVLLDARVPWYGDEPQILFGTRVAVEEFFRPAAAQCRLNQVGRFCSYSFFSAADADLLGTVDLRDGLFARLAATPLLDRDGMLALALALGNVALAVTRSRMADLFGPQFILDFCVQGLRFVHGSDYDAYCLLYALSEVLSRGPTADTWSPPLVHAARDTFFLPAVEFAVALPPGNAFRVLQLGHALEAVTGGDPNATCASLFCTDDFRDRFFVALCAARAANESCGRQFSAESARPLSQALANIAAAAPRAQRQAVFATAAFRDQVLLLLLQSCGRSNASIAAAFRSIAEQDDGSVHELFQGDEFRVLADRW